MEAALRSNDSKKDTSLVTEIGMDLQALVRQEILLARKEVEKEWSRGKNALALFAGSVFAITLGAGFIAFAIARGMQEMGIPLGIAFSLLGLLFVGVGVGSYFLGKGWARSIVTAHNGLNLSQENGQWLKTRH